jgi:hypothetical protein
MKQQTAIDWLIEQWPILESQLPPRIIEQAKEIEKQQQLEQNNTSNITRIEVIQHSEPYNGRAYTNYNAKNVELQYQDKGKTLKIFLK